MPVIEMRESIGDAFIIEDNTELIQVYQKRINLKEGSWQRNMLQMDLFFDDFPYELGSTYPGGFPGYIEFFLTPTPLILTSQTLQQLPNRGPDASNNNVLFKSVIAGQEIITAGTPVILPLVQKFPQDFLATNANFPFFHDQLYLTFVFHLYDAGSYPKEIRFNASMYMSYNEKKVKASRSAMGVISERFQMMIGQYTANGRMLRNPTSLQGQTIPSYQWGGIRPELMVSGSSLSQYWLKRDSQEAETMQTSSSLRAFAREARQMVANPDAFGTPNTAQGNVPDWFRVFLPQGVEAGAVREQFPPRVTQDDPTQPGLGNILMV